MIRRVMLLAAALLTPAIASAQAFTFTQVASLAGPADIIEVQDRLAYVAAGKTLTIVDVSDPKVPTRKGSYTFPELIWGVTPIGARVYVAADTYGLGILDVSNPAAPALVGSLKTPGQAKAVAVTGNHALVADHIRGIDVIDISTPAQPRLLASHFVDGFAKDVVVRGSRLFALDQPNGFNVLDVSGAGALASVSTATLPVPIPLRAQLEVSETASLAAIVGGGPVHLYDVTDPRQPVFVTTYRAAPAQRVALHDGQLYIAAGPAGLQVLTLATPSAPRAIAAHKTSAFARDVAISGRFVFLIVGPEEIVVLRRD